MESTFFSTVNFPTMRGDWCCGTLSPLTGEGEFICSGSNLNLLMVNCLPNKTKGAFTSDSIALYFPCLRVIEDYMSDKVQFVVTSEGWHDSFEDVSSLFNFFHRRVV